MTGLGWELYTNTTENVIDMLFLILTIMGTLAIYQNDDGLIAKAFSYLSLSDSTVRAMRLGRVTQAFRMLYKEKSMFEVMQTILSARKGILGIFIFVTFSLAMFSIITMHIFGGGLPAGTPYEDYPRSNFETFTSAFLTCMQFMIGLEWSKVMLWYMEHSAVGFWAAPYFCFMYFWIHGILYSLFVAVLLINFSLAEDAKMPTQRRQYAVYAKQQAALNESRLRKALQHDLETGETVALSSLEDQLKGSAGYTDRAHRSLMVFTCTNPFRLVCAKIDQSPWSTNIMLLLIVFSLGAATLEGNNNTREIKMFIKAVEVGILVSFYLEMFVKSIVGGFCRISGPTKPYLWQQRNVNNFMVLILITATHIPIFAHAFDKTSLKAVRSLLPMVGLLQHEGIAQVMPHRPAVSRTHSNAHSMMRPVTDIKLSCAPTGRELILDFAAECRDGHRADHILHHRIQHCGSGVLRGPLQAVRLSHRRLHHGGWCQHMLPERGAVHAGGRWCSDLRKFVVSCGVRRDMPAARIRVGQPTERRPL